MRINRFLASCGLGSRRRCEELVTSGLVTINGQKIKELATVVEPTDTVVCEGKTVTPHTKATVVLHKPPGVLCTKSDPKERTTIYDLLPPPLQNLSYVGRLDHESEGLLILTNDGELNQRLTHPSKHVEKEYWVIINRPFHRGDVAKLMEGIPMEEGIAKADAVQVVTPRHISLVLHQGMNRQIRRMFETLEYEVERLVRVRIGGLHISALKPGKWRHLHEVDRERLLADPEGKVVVAPPVAPERGNRRFAEENSEEKPRRAPRTRPKRDYGEDRRPQPARPRAEAGFGRNASTGRPPRRFDNESGEGRYERRPARPRAEAGFGRNDSAGRPPRRISSESREDGGLHSRPPRPSGRFRRDIAEDGFERERPRRASGPRGPRGLGGYGRSGGGGDGDAPRPPAPSFSRGGGFGGSRPPRPSAGGDKRGFRSNKPAPRRGAGRPGTKQRW